MWCSFIADYIYICCLLHKTTNTPLLPVYLTSITFCNYICVMKKCDLQPQLTRGFDSLDYIKNPVGLFLINVWVKIHKKNFWGTREWASQLWTVGSCSSPVECNWPSRWLDDWWIWPCAGSELFLWWWRRWDWRDTLGSGHSYVVGVSFSTARSCNIEYVTVSSRVNYQVLLLQELTRSVC